jgi:hypothetical protein
MPLTIISEFKHALGIPTEAPIQRRLRDLRHATPSPAQKAEGMRLIGEWQRIHNLGRALEVPNKRRSVCEFLAGKKLEDLDHAEEAVYQEAAIVHLPAAIVAVNARLKELHEKIERDAAELLSVLNKKYAVEVSAELKKAREALGAVFEYHGRGAELDQAGPVAALVEEHAIRAAGGSFQFRHGGPASTFLDFGITPTA